MRKYVVISDRDAARILGTIQENMKLMYRIGNQEKFDELSEVLLSWIKLLSHNRRLVEVARQDPEHQTTVVKLIDGTELNVDNAYLKPTTKTRQGF